MAKPKVQRLPIDSALEQKSNFRAKSHTSRASAHCEQALCSVVCLLIKNTRRHGSQCGKATLPTPDTTPSSLFTRAELHQQTELQTQRKLIAPLSLDLEA